MPYSPPIAGNDIGAETKTDAPPLSLRLVERQDGFFDFAQRYMIVVPNNTGQRSGRARVHSCHTRI